MIVVVVSDKLSFGTEAILAADSGKTARWGFRGPHDEGVKRNSSGVQEVSNATRKYQSHRMTVSALDRSTEFYEEIFKLMDDLRIAVPESTQQAMRTPLRAWVGPGYTISMRPSKEESAHRPHKSLVANGIRPQPGAGL